MFESVGGWLARQDVPSAVTIAIGYAVAGTLWLALGHHAITPLFPPEQTPLIEVVTAAIFIMLTGVVLGLALRALLRELQGSSAAQSLLAAELRALATEQQRLAHRLLVAEEATRRQVAKDLHDGPLQSLTLSFMQLDATVRAAEQDQQSVDLARLRDAMSTIQDASEEIRAVVRALHPPLLSELGLSAAVQRHCDEVARRSQRAVTFQGLTPLPALADSTSIALFRIVQEAVANAVKHTPASVAVTVGCAGGEVDIEVADDGPGFDVARLAGAGSAAERGGGGRGLGLVSMRERAASVGARLRVESDRRGTHVRVSVPVAPRPEDE